MIRRIINLINSIVVIFKNIGGDIMKKRENGEGSVYKTNNGKWKAQFQIGFLPNGGRQFKTKTTDTQREAIECLAEMKEKYGKLLPGDYSLMETKKAIERWLATKQRRLKATSMDRVESTMKEHVIPAIGDYRLCDLTNDIIREKIFDVMVDKKNLSHSSVKKVYDNLNNFFNYCRDNDWITKSPMKKSILDEYTFKAVKKVQSFTDEEKDKIILSSLARYSNGIPVYECGFLFPILFNTGMRIGEALGLKWSNVHLDGADKYIEISETVIVAKDRSTEENKWTPMVQANGKTKNAKRKIPLSEAAAEYFRLQKEFRYYGEDYYVFNVGKDEKTPMRASNVSRSFRKILDKNHIEPQGLHAIRHTFATNLSEKGANPLTISRILGHANFDITQVYVDTRYSEMKNAISALDV